MIVVHHNASLHVASTVRDEPCSLRWRVLEDPPHSPDETAVCGRRKQVKRSEIWVGKNIMTAVLLWL
jgi:transposase